MNTAPKILWAALAALAASPCFGESPGLALSQDPRDPLERQIHRSILASPNGGVHSFVGVSVAEKSGSGKIQAIELNIGQPDLNLKDAPAGAKSLKGLSPEAGLLHPAPRRSGRVVRPAAEQLKTMEHRRGWSEETSSHRDAL